MARSQTDKNAQAKTKTTTKSKTNQRLDNIQTIPKTMQTSMQTSRMEMYINNKINEGLQNNTTRPFWSWIKAKKQDHVGVAPLKAGNTLHTDSNTKAKLLLQQF